MNHIRKSVKRTRCVSSKTSEDKKLNKRVQKISRLYQQFGFSMASKYCFYKVTKQNSKYIRLVYAYMQDVASPVIREYNQNQCPNQTGKEEQRKIWVCWWQGYDKMPVLCKMCFNQLKSVLTEQYQLVLITQDNYMNYANIPEVIIRHLEEGKIPITQFSDILRQALLAQNGGVWIDSSVWCTEKVNDMLMFTTAFWSVKLKEPDDKTNIGQQISQCQWNSFLLGGQKGNIVNRFVLDCMIKYYSEHEYVLDYFLQNLLIRVGYENVPAIKEAIDSVEASNPMLYDLYRHMDDPFDQKVWDQLTKETGFFKLTQKRPYEKEIDGNTTFYGWLSSNSEI